MVIMEQRARTIAVITTICLAILGAVAAIIIMTTAMTSFNVIQQTLAAKSLKFCYLQSGIFNVSSSCYYNNGACKKAQSSDTQALSDCSKASSP
jgi:hypothetical protein